MRSSQNSPTDRNHRSARLSLCCGLAPAFLAIMSGIVVPASACAQGADGEKRAMASSVLARGELDAGNFDKAAELYHSAFKLHAAEPGYLYSAARAEEKGGDLVGAERDYQLFLKVAPPKHEKYEAAKNNLLQVRSQVAVGLQKQLDAMKTAAAAQAVTPAAGAAPSAAAQPVPAAPPPAAAPVPAAAPAKSHAVATPAAAPPAVKAEAGAAPGAWKRTAGYGALGIGAVGVGLGAWMMSSGNAAGEKAVDGAKAAGLDEAARSKLLQDARDADAQIGTGTVALGVGAGLAAVGGWLWWTAPQAATVAVVPTPHGVRAVVALRF